MTGQLPNSNKTGAAMAWQESYVFRADGTFTKARQQGNQLTQAGGTFAYQDLSDGKYVVLNYEAASPIIGTCTGEPTETLAVKAKDTLVGTWLACDGPGLEYRKVNPGRAK
jgi:hypothetical protein